MVKLSVSVEAKCGTEIEVSEKEGVIQLKVGDDFFQLTTGNADELGGALSLASEGRLKNILQGE